jgi:hypothetical protein
MNAERRFTSIALLSLCGWLASCSQPDPTIILGKWKADAFALEGLRIPLAPDFEVTRSQLILRSPDGTALQSLALARITAAGDTIELEFKDGLGISLAFTVERSDRVHFKVPLLGTDIAYSKQFQ